MSQIIQINKAGRLDKVLLEYLDNMSRSQIEKLFKMGQVSEFNTGKILNKSFYVEKEFTVVVELNNLILDTTIEAKNIPLNIIYEDEDILLINKKKGMVVHPGAGKEKDTLVHALLFYCGQNLSNIDQGRSGIVHRLDKDTAGLMLVAKNNNAHRILAEDFAKHNINRHYRCICYGLFKEKSGQINGHIARDPANRLKMAILPYGKKACSNFTVIEEFNHFSLLDLKLETGRTHQIRVHLEAISHPIIGDELYTKGAINQVKLDFLKGQCLYSSSIEFTHPITKEVLYFEIAEPDFFKKTRKYIRENNL